LGIDAINIASIILRRYFQARNSTVFTVRIHTATARKAAIDHPDAGVQICLFGGKAALMHRIGQMEQATDARDMMEEVCEVRIRLTDATSDSYTLPLLAQPFASWNVNDNYLYGLFE
jgi:hypothetical protein